MFSLGFGGNCESMINDVNSVLEVFQLPEVLQ